jgi:hypothetical protein
MNINDYQRPKSKSIFKLNKNLIEQKQTEIRTSLQKEIFQINKKNFNKSKLNFISKQQQVLKGNKDDSIENKEFRYNNIIRPKTHKYNNNDNNIINAKSFNYQSKDNSPKNKEQPNLLV